MNKTLFDPFDIVSKDFFVRYLTLSKHEKKLLITELKRRVEILK